MSETGSALHLEDASDLVQLALTDLTRRMPSVKADPPLQNPTSLPLTQLEPEVFERLVAEMVSRRDNCGVQFYGRRGQAQHGLDIVETGTDGGRTLYQVRRYQTMSATQLRTAVVDYAGPSRTGTISEEAVPRRFDPRRFIVVTSAGIDQDTNTVNALIELQDDYQGDLQIEAWGAESLSRDLRDAPRLVFAVFGPDWARTFCGFVPEPSASPEPNPYGLLTPPIEVLGLDPMLGDAISSVAADPVRSVRLMGTVATQLSEAGFPVHAEETEIKQADLAAANSLLADGFRIQTRVALRRLIRRSEYAIGQLRYDIESNASRLDDVALATASVLAAVGEWYEEPFELRLVVPHLETIAAHESSDSLPDQALPVLSCLVLEQALLDDVLTSALGEDDAEDGQFLDRLRTIVEALSSPDPVLRARLRCAAADARLGVGSTPSEVEDAYRAVVEDASAGRLLHARGMCLARAARQHARHGSDERAVTLWSQSVLASSEDRFYGDARSALLCLQRLRFAAADFNAMARIVVTGLPSSRSVLEGPSNHLRDALADLLDKRFPDAFGDARRAMHQAAVAGALVDEDRARMLFAEVLAAAKEPRQAVLELVLAGAGKRAESLAERQETALPMTRLLQNERRSVRAAAARVVRAQAKLVPESEVPRVADRLVGLAKEVWTNPWVEPHPEHEALKAIAAFGAQIPASVVDSIVAIAEPAVDRETHVDDELCEALIQTYWAVETRRPELALLVGRMVDRPTPPAHIWGLVAGVPKTAREHVLPIVHRHAELGSEEALRVLLAWDDPAWTLTAGRVARRRARDLLQSEIGFEQAAIVVDTSAAEVASDLLDLARAATAPDVDDELLPDEGPPDDADRLAAGPVQELVDAVASRIVAMAHEENSGADARAWCLRAVRKVVEVLAPSTADSLAERLFALHLEPRLTEDDELFLSMDVPLSRFRVRGGGRNLAPLALWAAAECCARSPANASGNSLGVQIAARAAALLQSEEDDHLRLGASALAAVAASLDAGYFYGLLLHPNEHVRAVGIARSPLDLINVENALNDPSAKVRGQFAHRSAGLPDAARRRLQADPHAGVRWVANHQD